MQLPLLGSPFELRVRDPSRGEGHADPRGEAGFVHSIHAGSTVDGPGVRLVIFLTGCEFRCLYCHNPDTWKLANGRRVTAEQVRKEIGRYAPFLKLAGGGVTISGGEPLVQDRFAVHMADVCRELGLPVALDTNGHLGSRLSDDELRKFDLFLLDLKAGDDAQHRRVTRQPIAEVLAFAERLARLDRPAWVRYVLVPGLTDAPEHVDAVAKIVAGLPNVRHVDVLPFHQLGQFKWRELGLNYELADTPAATSDQVRAATAIFERRGVSVG